jgi:hypothetical protein
MQRREQTMNEDLFTDPQDQFAIDPPELEPVFGKVLVMTLAKRLAAHARGRWTEAQETEMQERIAELVAEAKKHGLTSIRMNVVRTTGQRLSRDIDLARLSRERTLQ